MSLYQTQKYLYRLNRDTRAKTAHTQDALAATQDYALTAEERDALVQGNIGKLYVLGVNGQILMHFAAHLGIEWFDYLERMREGVRIYGPVRAGVYAMTGHGQRFAEEDSK